MKSNWKNEYPLNTFKGETYKELVAFISNLLSHSQQETRKQVLKIVEHAVYEAGAGNDVLISADVDEIMDLLLYSKVVPQSKPLVQKIERILLVQPIYTKPGMRKKESKTIEIIHKRDELLELLNQEISQSRQEAREQERSKMAREAVEAGQLTSQTQVKLSELCKPLINKAQQELIGEIKEYTNHLLPVKAIDKKGKEHNKNLLKLLNSLTERELKK